MYLEHSSSAIPEVWQQYVVAFEKALACKVLKRRYPTAVAYLKKIKAVDPTDERAAKEIVAFRGFILSNRPWPPPDAASYAQPAFESELDARVFLPNILTYHSDLPALQQILTEISVLLFPGGLVNLPIPSIGGNEKVVEYVQNLISNLGDISELTGKSFQEIVRCPQVQQLAVQLAEDVRSGIIDHQQLAGVMVTMLAPLSAQQNTPEVGLAIRMLTDLRDGREANMASVAPLLHTLTN